MAGPSKRRRRVPLRADMPPLHELLEQGRAKKARGRQRERVLRQAARVREAFTAPRAVRERARALAEKIAREQVRAVLKAWAEKEAQKQGGVPWELAAMEGGPAGMKRFYAHLEREEKALARKMKARLEALLEKEGRGRAPGKVLQLAGQVCLQAAALQREAVANDLRRRKKTVPLASLARVKAYTVLVGTAKKVWQALGERLDWRA